MRGSSGDSSFSIRIVLIAVGLRRNADFHD
jgi:hypothetical protein